MKCFYENQEKGNTTIIVALFLIGLVGLCALVIDVGRLYWEANKLQNAVDAAALAAAQDLPDTASAADTACEYIEANGFQPSEIQISFSNGNKTIDITSSRTVNFIFARLLGFESTSIHPQASASIDSMGGPFNYVLFSGSASTTLTLNGSSQYVQGSSHTNKNFVANGSKITITGACEAVGTVTVNGSQIDIPNRLPGSAYIEMPDFSDAIKQQAQAAGQAYSGSKTFSGSYLDVSSPIYVDGNVTVNGSHFCGRGCVLATRSITFNGSHLNETPSDAVCFYSKNGNITVNGSNAVFEGILYAPSGSITLNGSNQTVHGRVIGNTVTINGSNLQIIGGTSELNALPGSGIRLTK